MTPNEARACLTLLTTLALAGCVSTPPEVEQTQSPRAKVEIVASDLNSARATALKHHIESIDGTVELKLKRKGGLVTYSFVFDGPRKRLENALGEVDDFDFERLGSGGNVTRFEALEDPTPVITLLSPLPEAPLTSRATTLTLHTAVEVSEVFIDGAKATQLASRVYRSRRLKLVEGQNLIEITAKGPATIRDRLALTVVSQKTRVRQVTLEGHAPPDALVFVHGQPVKTGPLGTWRTTIPVSETRRIVSVAIVDAQGGLRLETLPLDAP